MSTPRARRLGRPTALSRAVTDNTMLRETLYKQGVEIEDFKKMWNDSATAAKDYKRKTEELTGQLSDLRERANTERADNRQRVDTLKRTIADIEKALAESQGYARALNERLEHDSPLVEVPQITTRYALHQSVRTIPCEPDRHYAGVASTERAKHWTAV